MSDFCVGCGRPVLAGESRCAACQPPLSDERWGPSQPPAQSGVDAALQGNGRERLYSVLMYGAATLVVVGVLFAIVPTFLGTKCPSTITGCKSNLKNIGTALEMYSADNKGLYPPRLALLLPNYLKTIPTCLSVGSDTYSGGYASGAKPDTYTVVCAGVNHSGVNVSANYPQYTSMRGLLEK